MKLHIAPDFSLPAEAVTQTFGILAVRGSGKSNAAVVMAEEMFKAGLHWVAIDPKGDWWGIRSNREGTGPGLPVVIFGGRHGDVPLESTSGSMIADLVVDQALTCILDTSEFTEGEKIRFLDAFAERLFRRKNEDQSPTHLFLEEADDYIPQRVMPKMAHLVGMFEKLVKQGRARGIGATLISQRSAVVNKNVLTQIETLIVLRTTSPQDRDAIKAWVSYHGQRADILETLPSLPNGNAWFWSPQWMKKVERIQFRQRETYDSGATPIMLKRKRTPATLADVNLEQLRGRMAETIEKAKQDDPRELRARIAKLERELTPTPEPALHAGITQEQMDGLIAGARQAERIEWFRLRGRLLSGIEDILFKVGKRIEAVIAEEMNLFRTGLPELAGPDSSDDPRWETNEELHGFEQTVPAIQYNKSPTSATKVKRYTEREPAESNGAIGGGALRMLQVLAQRSPAKYTRAQWGTLAGLAHTGGTFSTYMSRLRTAGYIESDSRFFWASTNGIAAVGSMRDIPRTSAEVVKMWKQALGGGAARMLDVLVESYPKPVSRAQLAEQCEITMSGGTFGTYLSRLSSNGLIEKRGSDLVASAVLFDVPAKRR